MGRHALLADGQHLQGQAHLKWVLLALRSLYCSCSNMTFHSAPCTAPRYSCVPPLASSPCSSSLWCMKEAARNTSRPSEAASAAVSGTAHACRPHRYSKPAQTDHRVRITSTGLVTATAPQLATQPARNPLPICRARRDAAQGQEGTAGKAAAEKTRRRHGRRRQQGRLAAAPGGASARRCAGWLDMLRLASAVQMRQLRQAKGLCLEQGLSPSQLPLL